MAEQMDVELISGIKKKNPDYTVVAYINTTSELKTICDVCVTSSSAVQIVKILKIPIFCLSRIVIWDGGLPIRCRRKISSCCRAVVRPTCGCLLRMLKLREQSIPTLCFWYIRSVCRRYPVKRITAEAPPGSWTMRRKGGAKEFIIGTENEYRAAFAV